jgi:hypothetical protein
VTCDRSPTKAAPGAGGDLAPRPGETVRTPSFGKVTAPGLIPSDTWKDSTAVKKTEKKRKEPKRTLSLKAGLQTELKEFMPHKNMCVINFLIFIVN